MQCNRLLRWCPSPDCNNVIKVQSVEPRPVTCKCFHTFCFLCGENWHDPVKCHLLKKWIKKCDDDSETSNWIAANTKVKSIYVILLILSTCVNYHYQDVLEKDTELFIIRFFLYVFRMDSKMDVAF